MFDGQYLRASDFEADDVCDADVASLAAHFEAWGTDTPGRRPWLTVVMPIHHGEQWVDATLASVVAGDAEGIEILFIDSSADGASRAIAETYGDRVDIRILDWPHLRSWTEKTNRGVAMARADHVVMLHQDDVWLPNRIAELRRWIAAAPDAAVQFAPTAIIDGADRRLGTWRCPLSAGPLDRATLHRRLLVQCFVSVPAPLFRRDAFLAVGGMDTTLWYSADWDLWLKLAAGGDAVYRDDVTTGFRIHGGSLTMTGTRAFEDYETQLRIVLDRHRGDGARAERVCETSIRVNVALARAARGHGRAMFAAVAALAALGPVALARYLRYSRLIERVLPRVRAGLARAA